MMLEMGYTSGIENYSRHMDGRKEGEPPYTLLISFLKIFDRGGRIARNHASNQRNV